MVGLWTTLRIWDSMGFLAGFKPRPSRGGYRWKTAHREGQKTAESPLLLMFDITALSSALRRHGPSVNLALGGTQLFPRAKLW